MALSPTRSTILRRSPLQCSLRPESFAISNQRGEGSATPSYATPPPDAPWTMPILWDHPTEIQTAMNAEADVFGAPKPDRVDYAEKLRGKASRLLVVNRLRTNTVRVSACYAPQPLLGSSWIPVRPISPNLAFEHALCAWWNSTPGILTLLHCRAKALDYARFALDSLRSLLIPNPNRVNITPLADAFHRDSCGSTTALAANARLPESCHP